MNNIRITYPFMGVDPDEVEVSLYLYTTADAHTLPKLVAGAIAFGKVVWNDPPLLTAVLAEGVTACGMAPYPSGPTQIEIFWAMADEPTIMIGHMMYTAPGFIQEIG